MNLDLFSEGWTAAWCEALNASEPYRLAARDWDGIVALMMTADGSRSPRGAILDSAAGACRSARTADSAGLAKAGYVFEAGPDVWQEVFTGRIAPAMALMTGKLKLSRGSLAALLPHAAAAREMLAAAATIPVRFPPARDG
jgi:putative sterol carrier protein